jgi:hypothetical protein
MVVHQCKFTQGPIPGVQESTYGHSQEISLDKSLVSIPVQQKMGAIIVAETPSRRGWLGKCTAEEEGRKGACDDSFCNNSQNGHQHR